MAEKFWWTSLLLVAVVALGFMGSEFYDLYREKKNIGGVALVEDSDTVADVYYRGQLRRAYTFTTCYRREWWWVDSGEEVSLPVREAIRAVCRNKSRARMEALHERTRAELMEKQ